MNFRTGLIIFFLLFLVSCNDNSNCQYSAIKSVGGCNRDGACGVTLEDGSTLQYVYQPTIGLKVRGNNCGQQHPL